MTDRRIKIATLNRTKEIIRKYGFSFKKSLGQNFLIDINILHRIVDAAELNDETGALEIGPGIGALTEQLAERAHCVTAVETDRRLLPILEAVLKCYEQVHIVYGDILRIDLHSLFQKYFQDVTHVSVVANLPYYITTSIIMKLLEDRLPLKNIVVMIQKEVAERMVAKPGSKDYGSLSVAVQYFAKPEFICTVPHTVFIPQPNIESTVIRLRIRQTPSVLVRDEARLFDVVRASFTQRRKTIWNNLKAKYADKCSVEKLIGALSAAQIAPNRRGETLSLEEFAALSDAIGQVLMYANNKN